MTSVPPTRGAATPTPDARSPPQLGLVLLPCRLETWFVAASTRCMQDDQDGRDVLVVAPLYLRRCFNTLAVMVRYILAADTDHASLTDPPLACWCIRIRSSMLFAFSRKHS